MASHSTEDAQRIYEEVPTWGPHPDVPAGQGRQRDTAGHPGAVGRPPFFFVQCIWQDRNLDLRSPGLRGVSGPLRTYTQHRTNGRSVELSLGADGV